MSNQKKVKPGNIIMDCIIAGVLLVLFIVGASSFRGGEEGEGSGESKKKAESTALPKALPQGDGIENYQCVIADENSNNTVFYISFDTGSMTFQETLAAKEQSSLLDKGTYEEKNGKYITKSEKSKAEHSYVKDGNYLIVESEMYEGEVPKADTFDATFTYEVPKEVKTTVHFKKDGTYEQEVLSYAVKNGSEDTTKHSSGTYTRKGKFVRREAENGEPLLDFYIYQNRLSNAYYKLVD